MDAWSKDLSLFQRFSFEMAETFFVSKGWTKKDSSRGYKFFAEGYVHDVLTNKLQPTIKGKCYRSQRKNEKPHTLHISFESSVEAISEAHCTCEAGNSQSCNHVVALAYLLQHLILSGFKTIPEDSSPTSLPMTWNKPRGKKISAQQLTDIVFCNTAKRMRSKNPISSKIRNPMSNLDLTKLTVTSMLKLKEGCKNYNDNIPSASNISLENVNNNKSILLKDDVYVPSCSFLGLQARANQKEVTDFPEPEELPLGLPLYNKGIVDILISLPPVYNSSLKELSFDEAANIEKQTRRQTGVDLWWSMRLFRFTASKFGYICKRKLFNDEFVRQFVTKEKEISNVKAVAHGKKYESVAAESYLDVNKHLKFFRCGLVIHPYAIHLGASPDGIIFDSKVNTYGLIEIKCHYIIKAETLEEYLKLKTFCFKKNENNYELKRNHIYYYQVQGQMLVTGLQWTDFIVFIAKTKEIAVERIYFDSSFAINMYYTLTNTYENHIKNVVPNN